MMTPDEASSALAHADSVFTEALKMRLAAAKALAAVAGGGQSAAAERDIAERAAAQFDPADRDIVFGVYERLFAATRGEIEIIARGVCRRDGCVLLCRGKGASSTYLPGGHVEFGETAREALVREMREETRLSTRAGRFLGVVENAFLQHGRPHCEVNLVYELALDDPNTSVTAAESWISFEWCAVDALAEANILPTAMYTEILNATAAS